MSKAKLKVELRKTGVEFETESRQAEPMHYKQLGMCKHAIIFGKLEEADKALVHHLFEKLTVEVTRLRWMVSGFKGATAEYVKECINEDYLPLVDAVKHLKKEVASSRWKRFCLRLARLNLYKGDIEFLTETLLENIEKRIKDRKETRDEEENQNQREVH